MPAQKDKLTPEEIAAVVMYVRQKLSGGKPDKGFSPEDFLDLPDTIQKVLDSRPEAATPSSRARNPLVATGPDHPGFPDRGMVRGDVHRRWRHTGRHADDPDWSTR